MDPDPAPFVPGGPGLLFDGTCGGRFRSEKQRMKAASLVKMAEKQVNTLGGVRGTLNYERFADTYIQIGSDSPETASLRRPLFLIATFYMLAVAFYCTLDSEGPQSAGEDAWEALYFASTTLTTVGFGDKKGCTNIKSAIAYISVISPLSRNLV